jgi:hypothetical protein
VWYFLFGFGACAVHRKWLGNTPGVANKHYLTVTEDHFQMAAAGAGQSEDENWGLTGDATARRASHDRAKEIPDRTKRPGKRLFLGDSECSGKHPSRGGGTYPICERPLHHRAELPGVQETVEEKVLGPQASTTVELGMELLDWIWDKLDEAERSELTLLLVEFLTSQISKEIMN